jgi:PAS domain S-box-containing protein
LLLAKALARQQELLLAAEHRYQQALDRAADSQHVLRTAFDAAPVAVAILDPDGMFLRVNDALRGLVGEPQSLDALAPVLTDSFDFSPARIRDAFASGDHDHFEIEQCFTLPDGSKRWLLLSIAPARRRDGTLEHMIVHLLDIDERKRREHQLHRELARRESIDRIRAALADDRFALLGQPIVELASGAVVAHELLLRMRGRAGELILPGEFLPAAEQSGLIREIDRWVLDHGIAHAAVGWRVEINLSGRSLADPALGGLVEAMLAHHGAAPTRVGFEVTETAMIERLPDARRFAEHVTRLGCHLALDDFGTGWGALTTAKALPVAIVKIDIDFIHDLLTNPRSRAIVSSVVTFARSLGARTLAEGVEEERCLALLAELGVDLVQGHLLGLPEPLGEPAEARAA